jgi:hypothetical protein
MPNLQYLTARNSCARCAGHGFIHVTGVCRAAREAMIAIARDWRQLLDAI